MESSNKNFTTAPVAKKKDHFITMHNDTRNDPYYWMRLTDKQKSAKDPDEQTRDVLEYLEAENNYLEEQMGKTKKFQDALFDEMVGRIKKDDQSVPYFENGYFYLNRYEKDKEYPIYSRKRVLEEEEDEVLIDVNKLAVKHSFYQTSALSVSPDNSLLAFGEDTTGRRQFSLRFKNISTGEYLEDHIPNTNGLAVWANDNKTIFYTVKDKALRSFKVFRHTLGTDPKTDEEIYHETDEAFRTMVYKSKSKAYIIIASSSTLSNEFRYLDAGQPYGTFQLFQERQEKLEYSISHYQDKWFILTNKEAENFKIMMCPIAQTELKYWSDYLPHREGVLVERFDIFANHFVVSERMGGITQLRIINKQSGEDHYLDLPEDAHLVYTGKNPEYDTATVRIHYTSLITPNSVYDYHMDERILELKKRQEVLGPFDRNDYRSERITARSHDGTEVPISIVYHKNTQKSSNTPLLLYGYGSYGISMDPYFSSVRLSLLNRGFIYAIAHIRGGEELGRKWYESGKLLEKKNTFYDFIHCAEYLIEKNYTSRSKLFAMGGSAGGLLIGAVMNMRPDLWQGLIAVVPFVDVVTTMLDESIPLTTGEFDEWGNPKDPVYYEYIKSYSPYDNVSATDYPGLLVTTGFHDSQVQYWEPAKWVAKLRAVKTDRQPLLMHCNMETGHGGASGRFRRLKETALEYTFLLKMAGGPLE